MGKFPYRVEGEVGGMKKNKKEPASVSCPVLASNFLGKLAGNLIRDFVA